MALGEVRVRDAAPGDEGAIANTHLSAFVRHDEADLARRLADAGSSVASLVAEAGQVIVGHAMLSRVDARIDGRVIEVLALAPVAVHPTHQNRGIGSRLVGAALDRAAEFGAEAVLVVGDPAFYGRFGFSAGRARVFDCRYAGAAFQAVEIVPGSLSGESGTVEYPLAFETD